MSRVRRRPTAWSIGAVACGETHPQPDVIEVRLRLTREIAASLEAGVPCREVRIERIGEDQVALLLLASNREQWLMHLLALAERAPQN